MTAVRIAHADPVWMTRPESMLVVLADDAATGRCRSGSAAMTPSSGACSAAPTTTTTNSTMIMPRR